jgi:monomeric isocitrate dehydrogenase
MTDIEKSIEQAGYRAIRKNLSKMPVILFMALDREDNNRLTSKLTRAVIELDRRGEKINIPNMMKETKYCKKEIELNLFEITTIMDTLGIE